MVMRMNDVHATKLIASSTSVQFVPHLHYCIADYDDRDILRGGTLYTEYWKKSCNVHFAGFRPNWISKQMLWVGFDFPFNQLGVKKLFGLIPEWNYKSRLLALHMGFKVEYLAHDVYDMPDAVNGMYIMSMLKDDCKWLKMKRPFFQFAEPMRTSRIEEQVPLTLH